VKKEMHAQQAFGVFIEPLDRPLESDISQMPTGRSRGGEPRREAMLDRWLELPPAPTRLVNHNGQVTMAPLAIGNSGIAEGLLFETIRHERRPYLAMLTPPGAGVRVNGVAAPCAAVLNVRDQVELDGAFLLHVSQFTRPYHGPASAEHAGRDCPVCLTPVAAGSIIFICPNCQAAMHAQGEETPAADRLECHLSSSTCPSCCLPIVREEGFAYVPEL
jgi:hypothetical protein